MRYTGQQIPLIRKSLKENVFIKKKLQEEEIHILTQINPS